MRFAAVFPGQGSQVVGMLEELRGASPEVERCFAEASEALGFDLGRLVSTGPAEQLDRTEFTQPALLVAGFATWRLWRLRGGPVPDAAAGHSLGEYTALAAAQVLDFADAVKLVHLRGKLMQEAVPAGSGAMAALLGLDLSTVEHLCASAPAEGIVQAANLNAPGQIVISGARTAVERVSSLAREAGAKRVIPLPVSVPSHSMLMKPASEKLAEALAGIELKAPAFPVVNNVDVAAPSTPAEIRDALVRQLVNPVRWTEVVAALHRDYGADTLVEFGPGRVLTGLTRRIDGELEAVAVHDSPSLAAALRLAGGT